MGKKRKRSKGRKPAGKQANRPASAKQSSRTHSTASDILSAIERRPPFDPLLTGPAAEDLGQRLPEASAKTGARFLTEDLSTASASSSAGSDQDHDYVVLGGKVPSWETALEACRVLVEATREAIGDDFERLVGRFGDTEDTELYLVALLSSATALVCLKRTGEAIDACREALRLDQSDRFNARFLLAAFLLREKRYEELKELLEAYRDERDVHWLYHRAFLAFLEDGDSERSRALLDEALDFEPLVAELLLDPPADLGDTNENLTSGREGRARMYVLLNLATWQANEDALSWLRERVGERSGSDTGEKQAEPRSLERKPPVLLQNDVAWEVGVRLGRPFWSDDVDDKEVWQVFVCDGQTGFPRHFRAFPEKPDPEDVWNVLQEAAEGPAAPGPVCWPAEVCVADPELHRVLNAKLHRVGVECQLVDSLPTVDRVAEKTERLAQLRGTVRDPEEALQRAASLPQSESEEWVVAEFPAPGWVEDEDGQMIRPPMVAVLRQRSRQPVHSRVAPTKTGDNYVLRTLLEAMLLPKTGKPHRPGRVVVSDSKTRKQVAADLRLVGVECVVDQRPLVERFRRKILSDADRELGLTTSVTSIRGVDPDLLEDFFCAAADYYGAAPWRAVPDDVLIRVDFEELAEPWYATILGGGGIIVGVHFWHNAETALAFLETAGSPESFDLVVGTSLYYCEACEIPFVDLDAIEQHGWPVAGPLAYPLVCQSKGLERKPLASASVLRRITAFLMCFPEFAFSNAVQTEYVRSEGDPERSKWPRLLLTWCDDPSDLQRK